MLKYTMRKLTALRLFSARSAAILLLLATTHNVYAECETYSTFTRSNNFIILGAGMINGPVKSITTTANTPDNKNGIRINGRIDLSPCGELNYFMFETTEGYPGLKNLTRSVGRRLHDSYQLKFSSELITGKAKPVTLVDSVSSLSFNHLGQITGATAKNPDSDARNPSQLNTRFYYADGLVRQAVSESTIPGNKGEILFDWSRDNQINAIISQSDGLPQLNYQFVYNDNRRVVQQTQTQLTPLGLAKSTYICQQMDQYGNCEKGLWQSVSEKNRANNLIIINTAIVTSHYTYY